MYKGSSLKDSTENTETTALTWTTLATTGGSSLKDSTENTETFEFYDQRVGENKVAHSKIRQRILKHQLSCPSVIASQR